MPNSNTNNTSMKTVIWKCYALMQTSRSEEGPSGQNTLTLLGKPTQVWVYSRLLKSNLLPCFKKQVQKM